MNPLQNPLRQPPRPAAPQLPLPTHGVNCVTAMFTSAPRTGGSRIHPSNAFNPVCWSKRPCWRQNSTTPNHSTAAAHPEASSTRVSVVVIVVQDRCTSRTSCNPGCTKSNNGALKSQKHPCNCTSINSASCALTRHAPHAIWWLE